MLQNLELYPFESAEMHVTAAAIIPPIFNLEVKGETGSLDAVIELVNTKEVEDGYLVVVVLGKDGLAIGSGPYKKSIDITEVVKTEGVVVKGADGKEQKLPWDAVTKTNAKEAVGFFHMSLRSESNLAGAPIVYLELGVDTVNEAVTGSAIVTQALKNPVVCKSHVTGVLISQFVMPPGTSTYRIDLTGYPEIHWPKGGGIGPVIPKNFTATLLFDSNWANGTIQYQYATASGWVKENQKIALSPRTIQKPALV